MTVSNVRTEPSNEKPFAVLVFPIFDDHVIWVQHPRRGWEAPGGKVEADETPIEAAHREVFEESGALIENLEWVGEYHMDNGNLKWIYFADVVDVKARPADSETTDVMVPRPMWDPDVARARSDVSYIMKDGVYQSIWPLLQDRIKKGES